MVLENNKVYIRIKSLADREKLDSKQVPYFISIFGETGAEGDIIKKGDELVFKGKGKTTTPVIKPQPEIIEE